MTNESKIKGRIGDDGDMDDIMSLSTPILLLSPTPLLPFLIVTDALISYKYSFFL